MSESKQPERKITDITDLSQFGVAELPQLSQLATLVDDAVTNLEFIERTERRRSIVLIEYNGRNILGARTIKQYVDHLDTEKLYRLYVINYQLDFEKIDKNKYVFRGSGNNRFGPNEMVRAFQNRARPELSKIDNRTTQMLEGLVALRINETDWPDFVRNLNDQSRRAGTAAAAAIAGGQQVAPSNQQANQGGNQQQVANQGQQQVAPANQVVQAINPATEQALQRALQPLPSSSLGLVEEGGILSGLDPAERERLQLLLNKQFLTASEQSELKLLRDKSGSRQIQGSRSIVPYGFSVVDIPAENPKEIFDSVVKKKRGDLTREEVEEFNEVLKALPKPERDYKQIVKHTMNPIKKNNPFHKSQRGYIANELRAHKKVGLLASIGDPFRVEAIPMNLRTPIPRRKTYKKHTYVPKIEVTTGFERRGRRN